MAQLLSTAAQERLARRFKFRHAVRTDVGLKREENQDAYGYAHTNRVSLFIVADGMGGARGGATASALAVDNILRSAIDEIGNVTEDSLREAITAANTLIFEHSREDESLAGMGTTVVVLALVGERGIIAHVGDSRIYRWNDKEFAQLTRDHTLVQELVDSGSITPAEAIHHPIAHMLTRSLGPTETVDVDAQVLSQPLGVREKYLLCCDGLYNVVTNEEMNEVLTVADPDEAVQQLINIALERGAPDNVTVEVIEVHDLNDEAVQVELPDEGKIRVVTSGSFDADQLDAEAERTQRLKRKPPPPSDRSLNGAGIADSEALLLGDVDLHDDILLDDNDEVIGLGRVEEEEEIPEVPPESDQYDPVFAGIFLACVLSVLIYALTTDIWGVDAPTRPSAQRSRVTPAVIETERADEEFLRQLDGEMRERWPKASVIPESVLSGPQPSASESSPLPGPLSAHPSVPSEEQLAFILDTAGGSPLPTGSLGRFTTPAERDAIIAAKVRLREEISDLDAKLWLFDLTTPEKFRRKRQEFEQEIEAKRKLVEGTEATLAERHAELTRWTELQQSERDILEQARHLGETDQEVKKKEGEYQLTQLRFREAVALFEENPNDNAAASSIAALGRELNVQRAYLEQAVKNAIDNGTQKVAVEISEIRLRLSDSQRELDRLHRHLAFFDGNRGANNRSLQRTLLQERAKLTDELFQLRTQLSDEDEVAYRRQTVVSSLYSQPTANGNPNGF